MRQLQMFPEEIREKAKELYYAPEINRVFNHVRKEGLNSDTMFIVFVAIVLLQNIENFKDLSQVKSLNSEEFLEFLKRYIQGRNAKRYVVPFLQ